MSTRIAREVKQIAVAESHNGYYSRHIVALCSDDTIWEIDTTVTTPKWRLVPPVPPSASLAVEDKAHVR